MAIYGPAFRTSYEWLVSNGYMPKQAFSDEWISHWLGFTVEEMWTTFAPQLEDSVWHKAAAIVGKEMDRRTEEGEACLFQGIPEALTCLKDEGYELAFLSNCRINYCKIHRKLFNLDQWFDAYYCAEAFGDIPKWQIYQRVADNHSRPHIMVGDRFHDEEVALKAGIPFVGCSYGFARPEELVHVDAWAKRPSDIPGVIDALLCQESKSAWSILKSLHCLNVIR